MATKSYLATVFIGGKEVSGAFGSGEFRSSLNFAGENFAGTSSWRRPSTDTKSYSATDAVSRI